MSEHLVQSDTSSLVDELIAAVRHAKHLDRESKTIAERRNRALGQIVDLVGGDKLAAIHNGEKRIGELLTEEADDDA